MALTRLPKLKPRKPKKDLSFFHRQQFNKFKRNNESPKPEPISLYVNPQWEDSNGDGLPDDHLWQWDGPDGDYGYELMPDGYRIFSCMSQLDDGDAGRRTMAYLIGQNTPGLELGATYRISIECTKTLLGTYQAAILGSNPTGITIVGEDRTAEFSVQWKELYIDFTIDDADYYEMGFVFGCGTTAPRTDGLRYRYPKLYKIADAPNDFDQTDFKPGDFA